jgi:hypothetical protein
MRFIAGTELSRITCVRCVALTTVKSNLHSDIKRLRSELVWCGQSVNVASMSSNACDSFERATNPYITSARSGSL